MAVYIALGSNLGDRRRNLAEALRLMPPLVRVEAVSALYESAPQPPAPPPSYLNAACKVRTDLQPLELLRYLKEIERRMGRRPGPRWSPRIIDLDIALYDDQVVAEPGLEIPHPMLLGRNFVLQPLLDIDPDLVYPVTGKRLAEVLERLGDAGLERAAMEGWEESPDN